MKNLIILISLLSVSCLPIAPVLVSDKMDIPPTSKFKEGDVVHIISGKYRDCYGDIALKGLEKRSGEYVNVTRLLGCYIDGKMKYTNRYFFIFAKPETLKKVTSDKEEAPLDIIDIIESGDEFQGDN